MSCDLQNCVITENTNWPLSDLQIQQNCCYTISCIKAPLYQFSSVAQSCPTLCDSTDCCRPGLPVHHQIPSLTQTHVHGVSDVIQPSHPLSTPSPAFNFPRIRVFSNFSFSHQVAKVLEFQLQHPSFQWIFRTDFH